MIDCGRYRSQQGRFRKVQSGFQTFFRKIMQGMSNIIFQVTLYMDGDFNNSRRLKNTFFTSRFMEVSKINLTENTFSESSYRAMN